MNTLVSVFALDAVRFRHLTRLFSALVHHRFLQSLPLLLEVLA
jgi:hypothetical protein